MMDNNRKPVVISSARLDSNFSGDGKASFGSGATDGDHVSSIAALQGGGYLLSGWSVSGETSKFSIAKVKADGSLDTSFSSDGWESCAFAANAQANAMATMADGRFVIVGNTTDTAGNSDIALAVYNSDGSLDTRFSGDGKLTKSLANTATDTAAAVAVQTDGKILVLANNSENFVTTSMYLLRYTASGQLDSSFSGNGMALANFDGVETVSAMTLMADGKIVVAGQVLTNNGYDLAIARFNSNGSLDSSFSGDGLLQLDLGNVIEQAEAIAVQPDGKILLAGKTGTSSNLDALLLRLNSDGSLDSSFDSDGVITYNQTTHDEFNAIALQANGDILVGGYQKSDVGELILARVHADGSPDTQFNAGSAIYSTTYAGGTSSVNAMAFNDNGQLIAAGDSYAKPYQFGLLRLDDGLNHQQAIADTAFTYQIPANAFYDPDGDTLSYSARLADGSPLPAWLTFNPQTRSFTGTPQQGDFGNYQLQVNVSDGEFTTSSGFQLDVSNDFIEALRYVDHFRWNSDQPNGSPGAVLTYSFMTEAPDDASELEKSSFSSMNDAQKQAVRDVLQQYAEIAGISFNEVAAGNGDLQCGNYSQDSSTAAYTGPTSGGVNLWVNSFIDGSELPSLGSNHYETLLHEIGHVLGLKHPGNYDGDSDGPFLPTEQDSTQFTVMSYEHRADNLFLDAQPAGNTYNFHYSSIASSTPLLFDMAAIQFLYGANHATRAGDNVYSFDPAQPFFQTLWDGGGFDSISLSGFSVGGVIDLRPGHFSSIPVLTDAIPPGYTGTLPTYQGINNLAIAYGANIEKAEGGSGSDTLRGNDGNNWLIGGLGIDSLSGGGGGDVFVYAPGDSNIAACDIITDFSQNDRLKLTGINGMGFDLADFHTSLQDTLQAIRSDASLANKVVYFADGTSGYYYVNGSGSGVDFDQTLVQLNNLQFQPGSGQLLGFDNPDNLAPTLDHGDNLPTAKLLLVGETLSFAVAADTFSDVDTADTLSYSASLANGDPLPVWLSFSSVERRFSGTPGINDTGLLQLHITASDSMGAKSNGSFSLAIKNPVRATNLGSNSKDNLNGGVSDDLLDGGRGADMMKGGDGDEYYRVDHKADKAIELANQGHDTVYSSVSFNLGSHLEDLQLTGPDAINGTGNDGVNLLVGNDHANVLNGGQAVDSYRGGKGDDRYIIDELSETDISELAGEGNDSVELKIDTEQAPGTRYTLAAYLENLQLTGKAAIELIGNDRHNRIIGNEQNNTLSGLAGNDILDGGKGADTLLGGLGNDVYYIDDAADSITEAVGEGSDSVISFLKSYQLADAIDIENLSVGKGAGNLIGNASNNNLTGNNAANSLDGAGGNDIINGGGGADSMSGGSGDDRFYVDHKADKVIELVDQGHDTVHSSISYSLGADLEDLYLTGNGLINGTGNDAVNLLVGNDQANVLNGGKAVDSYRGGRGDDRYLLDELSETNITELAEQGIDSVELKIDAEQAIDASYTLAAHLENLHLTGSATIKLIGNVGHNHIIGNDKNNSLSGLDGNDTLDGGKGSDSYLGGKGNDRYIVDELNETDITELAEQGVDSVELKIDAEQAAGASYTLGAHLENLQLIGKATIDLIGNDRNNRIIGNEQNNSLKGLAGNDILDGGKGADTLLGGLGNDVYYIDDVADNITEAVGEGSDSLISFLKSYQLADAIDIENLSVGKGAGNLIGNASNNNLTGNNAANSLDGAGGNDVINGGGGADTMSGGSGDDRFYVDHKADKVIELADQGHDAVHSSISYSLGKDLEDLHLTGNNAINGTGNDAVNLLVGNDAANNLDGAGGDDVINGGKGNDKLLGGLGADTFVFSTSLQGNFDSIGDFQSGSDHIRLSTSIFSHPLLVNDVDDILNVENFRVADSLENLKAAQDTDDLVLFDSHSGVLYFDVDGKGGANPVEFVTLTGVVDLQATDILLS